LFWHDSEPSGDPIPPAQQICVLGVHHTSVPLGSPHQIPSLFHPPPDELDDPPDELPDDEDEEDEEEVLPPLDDPEDEPPELLVDPPELDDDPPDEEDPDAPDEEEEDDDPVPLFVGSVPNCDEPSGENSPVSVAPLHAATKRATDAAERIKAGRFMAREH
jgi:hypothetical protein